MSFCNQPYIDVKDAAQQLGCSPDMVYKLLGQEELVGHKVGRKVSVLAESVIDYREKKAIKRPTPSSPAPRRPLLRAIRL